MERNRYKYFRITVFRLLLAAFALLFAFSAQSQVKTGNISTDPKPFSLLEIESTTGGVRVPQLTATQAAALKTYLNDPLTPQTEKDRAQGLLIYNTDAGKIEMWNNNNRNWKCLEDADCVNAESVTITAPVTVFTEYDKTNNLALTAGITGASANADPLYIWYRNDEPVAVGPVLTVKKEDLTRKWNGVYTVDVLTCGFNAVGNLSSTPINITVNKKDSIKLHSNMPAYTAETNVVKVDGYVVEATQPVSFHLYRRNPGLSIFQSETKTPGNSHYEAETQFHTITTASNAFSMIYVDLEGHSFESALVTVPGNLQFTQALNGITNITLNGNNYTLYQPKSEAAPELYVDVCRNLFFDHPRASLLSKAVLEKYADYLNPGIIPAGDYWVLDKTFTPLKGTVSYPSGKFTLVTSEASSGNFNVRCIRPETNF